MIKPNFPEYMFDMSEYDFYMLNQTFFEKISDLENTLKCQIIFESYLVQIPKTRSLGLGLKCVQCPLNMQKVVSEIFRIFYHYVPLVPNKDFPEKDFQELYSAANAIPKNLLFEP